MPYLITQLPPQNSVIFAGNIPDLAFNDISNIEGMEFSIKLKKESFPSETIIDEVIWPDSFTRATVKIRDVIQASLKHQLPNTDMFVQADAAKKLTIQYGATSYVLNVIKGGLFIPEAEYGSFDYNTFAATNLLSWMPADRMVKYREPNYVNYYNVLSGAQLYALAYYIDDNDTLQSQEYALYAQMAIATLYTFDVSFNALLVQTGEIRGAIAFDLYVKSGGSKKTNTQRVTLINDFDEYDDVFCFSNSLGGFESVRFTGKTSEIENPENAVFRDHNNKFIEYETTPQRIFKKYTGFFVSETHRKWMREFFNSSFRFHMRIVETGFIPERIAMVSQSAEGSRYNPNAYEFQFKYANQVAWQYNVRESIYPVNIDEAIIPGTVGDVPDGQFNEDFLNQTPLNQLTDETLNI